MDHELKFTKWQKLENWMFCRRESAILEILSTINVQATTNERLMRLIVTTHTLDYGNSYVAEPLAKGGSRNGIFPNIAIFEIFFMLSPSQM